MRRTNVWSFFFFFCGVGRERWGGGARGAGSPEFAPMCISASGMGFCEWNICFNATAVTSAPRANLASGQDGLSPLTELFVPRGHNSWPESLSWHGCVGV